MSKGYNLIAKARYQDALKWFNTEAKEYEVHSHKHDECMYGKARALFGLKQFEEAKSILENIIARKPTWVAPHITLCRIREAMLNFEEAEKAYHRGLKLTANNPKGNKDLQDNFQWFVHNLKAPQFTTAFNATQTVKRQALPDKTTFTLKYRPGVS